MALVPGERLSEMVKGRVQPSVARRFEDAWNRARLQRRARSFNEFLDKLLEREEQATSIGRPATFLR